MIYLLIVSGYTIYCYCLFFNLISNLVLSYWFFFFLVFYLYFEKHFFLKLTIFPCDLLFGIQTVYIFPRLWRHIIRCNGRLLSVLGWRNNRKACNLSGDAPRISSQGLPLGCCICVCTDVCVCICVCERGSEKGMRECWLCEDWDLSHGSSP